MDSIPNVMTVNGDGINDVFHLKNALVQQYDLQIYDRWGILLFETTSAQIDWDGKTLAGADVPTGTYYYILKATTYSNKYISKTGFLSLLR